MEREILLLLYTSGNMFARARATDISRLPVKLDSSEIAAVLSSNLEGCTKFFQYAVLMSC